MLSLIFENEDVKVYKKIGENFDVINESLRDFSNVTINNTPTKLFFIPAKGLHIRKTTKPSYGHVGWEYHRDHVFVEENSGGEYVINVGDTFYAFNKRTMERVEDIPEEYTRTEKDHFNKQVDRFMEFYSKNKIRVMQSNEIGTLLECKGKVAKIGCSDGYRELKEAGMLTRAGFLQITRAGVEIMSSKFASDLHSRAVRIAKICQELEP